MQLRTADFFAAMTKLNRNMWEVRRLFKCHLLKEAAGLFAILVPDSFFFLLLLLCKSWKKEKKCYSILIYKNEKWVSWWVEPLKFNHI